MYAWSMIYCQLLLAQNTYAAQNAATTNGTGDCEDGIPIYLKETKDPKDCDKLGEFYNFFPVSTLIVPSSLDRLTY